LQSAIGDRKRQRSVFRNMAKDMANRYINQMSLFSNRSINRLSDLLLTEPPSLSLSNRNHLIHAVNKNVEELSIPLSRKNSLLKEIERYKYDAKGVSEDIKFAMLNILIHRYIKRIPQKSFFTEEDVEPSKPLNVDGTIFDAARIHLLHKYDRPYFYGINDLCDASSENAEQFLRLAAILVDTSATQLIRSKSPSLDAITQNKLLRQRADEIIEAWNFPQYQLVRILVNNIANRCIKISLESNAWLGAGANAYGILQKEFEDIPQRYPELARVLQFGIAYNAFTIIPHYTCKNQEWCLLELGGMVLLSRGLTLKRGGFLEGTAKDMYKIIQE